MYVYEEMAQEIAPVCPPPQVDTPEIQRVPKLPWPPKLYKDDPTADKPIVILEGAWL